MTVWSRSTIPFPAMDLIRQASPFSAEAQRSPHGEWLIGFGSRVMPNGMAVVEPVPFKPTTGTTHLATFMPVSTISMAQADNLLASAMPELQMAVAHPAHQRLEECEAAALISLVHGEGADALVSTVLIGMLNAGRRDTMAAQLPRWSMVQYGATSKLDLGLLRRRVLEMRVFEGHDVHEAAAEVGTMSEAELIALKDAGDVAATAWLNDFIT